MEDGLIPADAEQLEQAILLIRGQRVIMDSFLAQIYGVETKAFVRQVKQDFLKTSHFSSINVRPIWQMHI